MAITTYAAPAGRTINVARNRRGAPRADWRRVLFIVVVFLLSSGVPTLLAGMTNSLGRMIAAGIALATPAFALLVRPKTFRLARLADFLPLVLFAWFFFVSFVSNTFIFGYGLSNWLLPMYLVVPMLFFYLWWSIGASANDVVVAIVFIGITAAIVVIADQVYRFPVLDELTRLSAFTERNEARRVIFLRNECVLALLLTVAMLFRLRGPSGLPRAIVLGAAAAAMGFMIFRVFESRVAILAIGTATLLHMLFSRVTASRRVLMIGGGLVASIPVLFYAFDRYLAPLLDLGITGYSEKFNVDIRIESFAYWLEQFQRTMGLGIGVMSLNPDTPNIQSSVIEQSFIINDMGIAAALFQFGVPGLITAIGGTCYLIWRFLKLGHGGHPQAPELYMTGCFLIAFELQPIPVSFLTVQTALPLGATLWYLARRANWENARARSAAREAAVEPMRNSKTT